jgi:hypothetical protein
MTLTVEKHPGVKCPRCYRYTGEGRYNYDGLCDRCCEVILKAYPDHVSVQRILQCRIDQRKRWIL